MREPNSSRLSDLVTTGLIIGFAAGCLCFAGYEVAAFWRPPDPPPDRRPQLTPSRGDTTVRAPAAFGTMARRPAARQ
jgi:hypothetical protein